MMMTRSRFLASNCGSAEMPSSSGISMSSTATSGLMRSSWLTASRPVRSEATTSMSGSALTQREISPRMTTESSTTITRNGSCRVPGVGELANATLILHHMRPGRITHNKNAGPRSGRPRRDRSDQANFLEFGRDDVLVERLHDVFVGAGMVRTRDMRHVVLRGAEHHLRHVAAGHAAQIAEELVRIHHRPVPVAQDRIGQTAHPGLKRLLAVLGIHNLEIQTFQDAACDFPDDARVINNKTCSHFQPLVYSFPARGISIQIPCGRLPAASRRLQFGGDFE